MKNKDLTYGNGKNRTQTYFAHWRFCRTTLIYFGFRKSTGCSWFSYESYGRVGSQNMHSFCEKNKWKIFLEFFQEYTVGYVIWVLVPFSYLIKLVKKRGASRTALN